MHSEKISKDQSSAKNESLMIDSPDSAHEKQADSIAMKVIHGDQLTGGDGNNNGMVNTKGAKTGEQGMVAPGMVKEKIESTKGSGDVLPENVKTLMKGQSDKDLDEVRIHTDSNAVELSKAINAKAFTYGKDIYFGQGQFDTYTSEGKELLAHELTHTKQNTKEGSVIQRAFPAVTSFGEFNVTRFGEIQVSQNKGEAALKTGPNLGLEIILAFKPYANVDAKRIGLIQAAKGYIGNDFKAPYDKYNLNQKHILDQTLVTSGTGAGFHIDQESSASPVYTSSGKLEANKTDKTQMKSYASNVGISPISGGNAKFNAANNIYGQNYQGFGDYGYRYIDERDGLPQIKEARLHDNPFLASVTRQKPDGGYEYIPDSGQIFETSAFAVEGNDKSEFNQEGSYYGSVQWGWAINGSGEFYMIWPKTISTGVPTKNFMAAAQKWNSSKTVGGAETVDIPLTDVWLVNKALSVSNIPRNSSTKPKALQVPANTKVKIISIDDVKKTKTVEVVEGALFGEQFVVASANLTDEKK